MHKREQDYVTAENAEQNAESRIHRAIDAVWRIESPRLIAGLVRLVGDVRDSGRPRAGCVACRAREVAGDVAFLTIRERGLMASCERIVELICVASRYATGKASIEELGVEMDMKCAAEHQRARTFTRNIDDDIGDDLLRLVFMSCHPGACRRKRGPHSRCDCLVDSTTDEIARAFLVPVVTIFNRRIVRAKKTLN